MDERLERVVAGVGIDPKDWPADPSGTPAELLDAWCKAWLSLEGRWEKLLADAPRLARRLNRWRDDRDQTDRLLRAFWEAVDALPPRKRQVESDRFVELMVGLFGSEDGEAS